MRPRLSDRSSFLAVVSAALSLAVVAPSLAQESGTGASAEARVTGMYTEGLVGVDLSGMTPEQKQLALRILNESACDCGCGMTVAQCRVEDENCPRSPVLARAIVDAVRRGESEKEVRAAYRRLLEGGDTATLSPRTPPRFDIEVGDSPSRGPSSAAVTIVEFSDFECPFCVRSLPVIEQVLTEYPDDVRLVFKHLPLPIHPRARDAALAAEAARVQGKFWEMHDLLFMNRGALARTDLVRYAGELGLDTAKFKADMESEQLGARVDRDAAEAQRVGVTGTPAFYVNGKRLNSYQLSTLRRAIEAGLGEARAAGR